MRKVRLFLMVAAICSTQLVFADNEAQYMSSDNGPCGTVAKTCLDAGFTRSETTDKKFWFDCMKPIMLGKTVQGVTIDAAVAKDCRVKKINEMKKELKELQKVAS